MKFLKITFEGAKADLTLWRAVEAQHIASTLRLVDSPAEQDLLEAVLEASKPPLPEAARGLHYLLATPFRYPSPYGSRFRGRHDPGVWYGAESAAIACAELGYWRWRFVRDSAGLSRLGPSPQTVFSARVSGLAVDLRAAPLAQFEHDWMNPADYTACQHFARSAREQDVDLIRYASVRHPDHGGCGAVLSPLAFSRPKPISQPTWFLSVSERGVMWRRGRMALAFVFSA